MKKYIGQKASEYFAECAREAIAFLKEHYDETWNENLLCLWKKPGEKCLDERREESYRRHLGAFHFLFSQHNERFDVFLKDCLCADDGGSPRLRFTKDDFTKEEWKMVKAAQDFCIRQTGLRPYGACYSFPNVSEPILTERLTLRPPTIEDFREIRRHFQTDKEGRIAYCGPKEKKAYPKECFDFVIERNADKKLLGFVGTGRRNDLTYFVFKEYRLSGYATEAVKAFCAAAFSGKLLFPEPTPDRTVFDKRHAVFSAITLTVLAGNEASAKVAEKSGFILEGLYEKSPYASPYGEFDTLYYHLIKE